MFSLWKELSNEIELTNFIFQKKICLWLLENLQSFEKISDLNLYSSRENNRKKRPFLSSHCYGDTFACVFLTSTSKGNQKSVDLTLCEKRNCGDFTFFEKVFIFRLRGKYLAIPLNRFQLEEIAKLCGCCENLERIKKFCSHLEVEG